ncbi:MAG: Rod shape-determining protein RodA [Bacteroidetes bacterium ADurb.Bin416]|nr:MAG: Rod shape-determining protein RodA [Bacteroidetes bacterium ADurb.Bin416]
MYQIEKNRFWSSLDWPILLVYVLLCVVGCLSIYGASYDFEQPGFFDLTQRSGKQFLWFSLALFIGVVILFMDSNKYFSWAFMIYGALMVLMVATIFVAQDIKGSRSWLVVGPLHLQPAEFAKVATALALSRVMGSYTFSMKRLNDTLLVALLLFIPIGLTLMQKETGSALVFLSLMLMLYREGMPGTILFLAVCLVSFFIIGLRLGEVYLFGTTSAGQFVVLLLVLVVVCGMLLNYRKDIKLFKIILFGNLAPLPVALLIHVLGWISFNLCLVQLALLAITVVFLLMNTLVRRTSTYLLIGLFVLGSVGFLYATDYVFDNVLEPHHQQRTRVFLGMEQDLGGAGYNVNQSKIAIGSGGFWGKGFLNGTQTKLKYVPEQDTDFIFCTVGEEQGFVGSVVVLALYLFLLVRLIIMAERQRSPFSRIYGYCVMSIFLFHFVINIGMVLGLVPVIGIPLPFLSYGGSSLWAFTILLFIFIRLDADRSMYG